MEQQHNRFLLKALLITQVVTLFVYTGFAINREGWTLFNIFVNNIFALNWNGQFNLDFSCYLILSGIWIMWRNKFTTSSVILAIITSIIGIISFAPYLMYLLAIENGDVKKLLVGNR